MSEPNEAEKLGLAWINGWIEGKPDEIPLTDDFTHSSPFGVVSGRQEYLEWVKPLSAQNVMSLTIVKTLGGKDEAAIWFEMRSPKGTTLCCDWLHIRNGKIASIQSFYDPSNVR